MKDRSLNLSFSRVKKVHGVEIKKMKCGEFIAAMEELKDLPARVVDKLFNGDVDAAIDQLKHMDKQRLFELLGRLLFLLPEEIIGAVNYLIGIPREQIEELTPSQLLEDRKSVV